MIIFFTALTIIVAALLILIIMVQNPKGGGLSSTFGGNMNIGGVQSTNTFLDKSTWTLAAVMVGLVLISNLVNPNRTSNGIRDNVENILDGAEKPAEKPVAKPSLNGTEAPAQNAPAQQAPAK